MKKFLVRNKEMSKICEQNKCYQLFDTATTFECVKSSKQITHNARLAYTHTSAANMNTTHAPPSVHVNVICESGMKSTLNAHCARMYIYISEYIILYLAS